MRTYEYDYTGFSEVRIQMHTESEIGSENPFTNPNCDLTVAVLYNGDGNCEKQNDSKNCNFAATQSLIQSLTFFNMKQLPSKFQCYKSLFLAGEASIKKYLAANLFKA